MKVEEVKVPSVFQCLPGSPRFRGAARWRRGRGTPSVWGARRPGSPSPALPGTSLSGPRQGVTWPVVGPATPFPTWTSPPPGTTSAPLSTELVTPGTPPWRSMFSVSQHYHLILSSVLLLTPHSQTFTDKIETVGSIFETKIFYLFILNTKKKLGVFTRWNDMFVLADPPEVQCQADQLQAGGGLSVGLGCFVHGEPSPSVNWFRSALISIWDTRSPEIIFKLNTEGYFVFFFKF